MLRIHTRVGQIGFKTHICATSRLNIEAIKDEHYVLTQNTKLHQQPWQKNLATIPNQDLILSIVKGYQNSPKLARERHTLVGPSARNLLHHYGIDPSSISPTGPHNVILKTDVLKFIEQQKIQPASSQSSSKPPSAKSPSRPVKRVAKEKFKDNELSNMRKTIAKRLTLSKTTIPHAYMITDCKLNDILKLRQEYKRNNIKTSVNDFVIKAAALSLKQVKEINVLYDEQKNIIQYLPSVDIAIAVATDSGLITPIIREANKLKVDEISSTVKQLADKARQGKLQPHEFQGGTFSISNLGMFGITEFSAVINPPQSAILAIGSSRFVLDDSDVIDQVFSVTLSYDARAISEESAAKFLEILKTFIETPSNLERYGDGTDLRRLSFLGN